MIIRLPCFFSILLLTGCTGSWHARYPLHDAADDDRTAWQVPAMLESGRHDPNKRDTWGFPAIYYAAEYGHMQKGKSDRDKVIAALLDHGADLHYLDTERHTIFYSNLLTYGVRADLVARCFDQGLDAKMAIGVDEYDPPLVYLYKAWKSRMYHISHYDAHDLSAITEAILRNGGDINAKGLEGNTVLHHAARWRGFPDRAGFGAPTQYAFAQWLIDHGADPATQDHKGNTPLHLALSWGWGQENKMADILVNAGAPLNIKNNNGQSPADRLKQSRYQRFHHLIADKDSP